MLARCHGCGCTVTGRPSPSVQVPKYKAYTPNHNDDSCSTGTINNPCLDILDPSGCEVEKEGSKLGIDPIPQSS